MSLRFPLDNIRYFYTPSVPDGWPDLQLVNVRRTIPEWIAANCVGAVNGWQSSLRQAVPLQKFAATEYGGVDANDPSQFSDVLSTELCLDFENKNDFRKFSNYWQRNSWTRYKLLETRYVIDHYSISSCLWILKVELLQYRKDIMGWLRENASGEYEYVTFAENKKCVIGLEFERAEDADLFHLFHG